MNDRTNQVTVGVVVVILILGAWYAGRMQSKGATVEKTSGNYDVSADLNTKTESTGSTAVTAPSKKANGESVTVVDQPAGAMVKVVSVTLAQTGWVAVRDSGGRVLGAGRFSEGTSADVSVELLRNTVAGEKYQVLLYVDDGDNEYDLHKDSLVMNADASVAGAVFSPK